MTRIYLTDTLNTRDIGGYIGYNNRRIKNDMIIRSDILRYIEEYDKEFLLRRNIIHQIDLRTEDVIKNIPSPLSCDSRFFYHSIPIKEGSLKSLKPGTNISSLYMDMVSNTKAFHDIFKIIASVEKGIIINCTAGKDRTGVTIYLILSLLGVDVNVIKEDYLLSQRYIDEKLHKICDIHSDFPKYLGEVKEEYFDGFHEKFMKKYGDVESYLLSIGITKEEMDKIKERILE